MHILGWQVYEAPALQPLLSTKRTNPRMVEQELEASLTVPAGVKRMRTLMGP